jgi:regulator of sirC expression with transglutaminase-like and TPR domain
MKLNDLKGALKDVNKAIELNPYNSYAFRNRALIYLTMKEKEKACEDLHAAVRKGFTEEFGYEVRDSIDNNCIKK